MSLQNDITKETTSFSNLLTKYTGNKIPFLSSSSVEMMTSYAVIK